MSPPSPALLHKIAKARANAVADLPLVRRCASVVLAWVSEEGAVDGALKELKAADGANWSLTTALQLLSGRRGQFAAECGTPDEQAGLYLAHLVARSACSSEGLGSVEPPTPMELAQLRERVAAQAGTP